MSCDITINSKLYKSILLQSSSVDSALRTYLEMKQSGMSDEVEISSYSPKEMEASRYDKLYKEKSIQLKKIKEQLAKTDYKMSQAAKRKEDTTDLRQRRNSLQSRINGIEEDLKVLKTAQVVDSLHSVYLTDIEHVDRLLNSDEIEDLYEAQSIMEMYKNMGDFSDMSRSNHPLFPRELLMTLDPDGKDVKMLQQWAAAMQLKQSKWTDNFKSRIESIVNNSNRYKDRTKISYDEIVVALKDMGKIDSSVIALGNEGIFGGASEISKVIMDYILEDRNQATLEVGKKTTLHRSLLEKAQKSLESLGYKGNQLYSIFKQMHNGKFTGRLASRFSQNFYDTKKDAFSKIYANIDKAIQSKNVDKIQEAYRNKERWKRENEIMFDIRALPEIIEKYPIAKSFAINSNHKAELIEILGEKGYQEQLTLQMNKIDLYLAEAEYMQDSPDFELWERVNSPFWAATYLNSMDRSTLKFGGKYLNEYELNGEKANYRGYEYLSSVPRRTQAKATWNKEENHFEVVDTGKALDYYDDNFAKIESNKDVYDYYKFMTDSLIDVRNNLPLELQERFETIYDIPLYKKDFVEKMFGDKGFDLLSFGKLSKDSLYDFIIDGLSDSQESTNKSDVSEFGKEREGQSYSFVGNRREKVMAVYQLKLNEYMQANGMDNVMEVSSKTKRRIKDESEEEVAEEHSFDLGKVMEVYLYQATHAKFREQTLPMLDLLEDAAKNIPKVRTNNFGQIVYDEGNPLIEKDGIRANEVSLIANALKIHKGIPVQKKEGESNTKVFTTEDKAEMARISKLLEGDLDLEERAKLEYRLSRIGKIVTGSGVSDSALGFLRVLGLGWNLTAMLPNAAAGYFSNFIEASDGRLISLKAMQRAYHSITHSTLKLASLGKVQTSTAKKIANFMLKADVLLDSTNEFQKAQVNSKLTGNLSILHPMMLNKIVEYPNQATTAISRLMTIEVESGVSLWDALDENMNILPKYKEWDFEGNLFQAEIRKIKELVKKVHGDYSEEGRMQMKNVSVGRMLAFFKTWLARTVVNRFGAYDNTTDLGVQKGRYKSLTEGSSSLSGAIAGTVFMPGIGTVIGGFGGWIAGKLYGRQAENTFIQDFFGTGMDLVRKLLGSRGRKMLGVSEGKYNNQFDELDAANMRANVQELSFMLCAIGTYLIAKAAFYDPDEPDEDQAAINVVLNQINRVTTDLTFFTNPQSPKNLVDQAIPAARILTNGYKVMGSGLKVVFGKEIKANENTFAENASKFVPSAFRPILGEPIISRADMEKEMFPNQGWNYILYGAE